MSFTTKIGFQNARIIRSVPVKETNELKWIGLEKIIYQDVDGVEREWDMAIRKTTCSSGIDCVAILAILKHPNHPDRIVLQKQFRPPVEGVCIEMPAGLIDEGETVEEAAIRELKEETGYSGKIISRGPVIFNDPGFTKTNISIVTIEIDETLPENANPVSQLEQNEFIECFNVPLKDLPNEIAKLNDLGYKLDARVENIVQGMKIALKYKL